MVIFITFGDKFKNRIIVKNYILLLFIAALPMLCSAQKITLGSCETKDGGMYQGELVSGKPNGKGKTVYKMVIHMKVNM